VEGAAVSGLLAGADCEAIHAGWLRQPVNAISSLAFVAAGIWILLRARRRGPGERGELIAFATTMLVVGAGSFVLHGPDPAWGLWFHDLSNLAAVLLVGVLDRGARQGWRTSTSGLVFAGALALLALVLGAVPSSTVPIACVLVPLVVVVRLDAIRAGVRPRPSPRDGVWVVALGALALGSIAFWLGRTGSSLCDPDGFVQLHALWHVLIAIAAAAFATRAFRPASRSNDAR
jgi:hypothetical protein